jgi:hypothetical protein
VFDGVTGQPLAGVLGSGFNPLTLATGKPFTKGFWVASADFNNDGKADVIVAPGSGLSPIVKVISGADGATELASLSALFPETGTYKKGVRVASGDVTGDGRPDLIAQAGPGTTVKSPLFIAAGDVDGDGKADIIASAGKGTPLVRILDENSTKIHEFPGNNNPAYKGGMRVAVTDADEDGKADVIIGTGKAKGLQPQVRVVDPESLTELDSFFAFDPGFKGGMWVAGA